jgi:RNA polymerase sigma-70 factor (ECF subfamily)
MTPVTLSSGLEYLNELTRGQGTKNKTATGQITPSQAATSQAATSQVTLNQITETSEISVGVAAGLAKEETDSMPVSGSASGSISEMDDHSLLAATREGDEAAFQEIVRRYRNQITNYVYRMIDDYDRAVDIAQETFVRVYMNMERYQATYSFSTYIYRIAHNLAITELRQRKRRRLIPLPTFFSDKDSEEVEVDLPDQGQVLADEAMIASERRQAVTTAIASLPEKYRAALVLCDLEEKSYEEISEVLGLPTGTVKSRINRARNLLKEKLRELL